MDIGISNKRPISADSYHLPWLSDARQAAPRCRPVASYCFLRFSRPRFPVATRFYYPGQGSSQFSLASHNSPRRVPLVSSGHAADATRCRCQLASFPLILKVWQFAGRRFLPRRSAVAPRNPRDTLRSDTTPPRVGAG